MNFAPKEDKKISFYRGWTGKTSRKYLQHAIGWQLRKKEIRGHLFLHSTSRGGLLSITNYNDDDGDFKFGNFQICIQLEFLVIIMFKDSAFHYNISPKSKLQRIHFFCRTKNFFSWMFQRFSPKILFY